MPRRHRPRRGEQARKRSNYAVRPAPAGQCDTCGKARYRTQQAAAKAADLNRPTAGAPRSVAYPCPHSAGWWHVGHRSPTDAALGRWRDAA